MTAKTKPATHAHADHRVPAHTTPPDTARKVSDEDGEGEGQLTYLEPAEGGSYQRLPNGSLRRMQEPTKPADFDPKTDTKTTAE